MTVCKPSKWNCGLNEIGRAGTPHLATIRLGSSLRSIDGHRNATTSSSSMFASLSMIPHIIARHQLINFAVRVSFLSRTHAKDSGERLTMQVLEKENTCKRMGGWIRIKHLVV